MTAIRRKRVPQDRRSSGRSTAYAPINPTDVSFPGLQRSGETTVFEWDPETYKYFKRIKDAQEVTIPKLNEMACEQVELASVPYVSFVDNKKYSFVLRGYVRHWLGQVWREFDRVRLVELISQKSERNIRQAAS